MEIQRTRSRWVGTVLALLLASAALGLPATAGAEETESASQAITRKAVEAKSAQLGVAQNEAQAILDQKALASVVERAVKDGDGMKLLETTKDGSVAFDVVKDMHGLKRKKGMSTEEPKHKKPKLKRNGTEGKEIEKELTAASARVHHRSIVAHSATCWGGAWTQLEWAVAPGAIVGWLYANAGEWCGNGSAMEYLSGPILTTWSWGPFCINNQIQEWAWDVYNSWVHTGQWGSIGVSYPWGCFNWEGEEHATVRIAANGYWDTYDDFGF
jgi:hypothetical protein